MPIYVLPEDADPFDIIAADKQRADARIQPWQAAIKKGDHFFYFSAGAEIVVWGEVLEDQEDPEMFGYRFCKCHSIRCPDGEKGEVHVSVIHRVITSEVYEAARKANWPHDEPTFRALVSRLKGN